MSDPSDGWQGAVNSLIEILSPTTIYANGFSVTETMLLTVSPVLLVIAAHIRVTTTASEMIDGNGKWVSTVKAVLIWGSVLALYWGVINLITGFFNSLYGWSESQGSISMLLGQYADILEQVENYEVDADWIDLTVDFVNHIPRLLAFFIYFLTYVLVIFVVCFLGLAHGLGFSVCILFGTIAIPSHVAGRQISLLKGWAVMGATILFWPLIENIAMFLFKGLIDGGFDLFQPDHAAEVNLMLAGVYFAFAVLNLIVCAIVIAVPFVTYSLVSNSGSIGGLVSPFVGAAIGATAALGSIMKGQSDALKQQAGGAAKSIGLSGLANKINSSPDAAMTAGKNLVSQALGGGQSSGSTSGSGESGSSDSETSQSNSPSKQVNSASEQSGGGENRQPSGSVKTEPGAGSNKASSSTENQEQQSVESVHKNVESQQTDSGTNDLPSNSTGGAKEAVSSGQEESTKGEANTKPSTESANSSTGKTLPENSNNPRKASDSIHNDSGSSVGETSSQPSVAAAMTGGGVGSSSSDSGTSNNSSNSAPTSSNTESVDSPDASEVPGETSTELANETDSAPSKMVDGSEGQVNEPDATPSKPSTASSLSGAAIMKAATNQSNPLANGSVVDGESESQNEQKESPKPKPKSKPKKRSPSEQARRGAIINKMKGKK